MDPNAALAAIRRLIDTEFRDVEDSTAVSRTRLAELVEGFRALDDWLASGGFLPMAWVATSGPWRLPPPEPLGPPNPAHGDLPDVCLRCGAGPSDGHAGHA